MTTAIRVEVGTGSGAETFWMGVDTQGIERGPGLEDQPDEPDFVLIVEPVVLTALRDGSLDVDVGYMQGRVKLTGNVGRFLDVLPLLKTPEFREALPSPGS